MTGRDSSTYSEPADLLPFLAAHRNEIPWSVCAFGPMENACATVAAALGGHFRVCLENNLYLPDASVAPDNTALVRLAAVAAGLLERPLASADNLRATYR